MYGARPFTKTTALFLCLILAACTLPTQRIRNLDLRIVEPKNNQVMFVGGTTNVTASSYATDGSANPTIRFIFYANGLSIGESAASAGSDASTKQATVPWSPTTAGEYQIQTDAYTNSSTNDLGGVSAAVRVCVLDIPTDTISQTFNVSTFVAAGYSGPCLLPPPAPTNPGDISFNMLVGTQATSFVYPTEACPSVAAPTVLFTVTVDRDPSDQLALILVDLTWGDGFADTPLALSPSGTGPAGEKIYTGSWTLPDFFTGTEVTWTAYAYGRDGALLSSSSDTLTMSPCMPAPGKPEDPSTPTPASEADCPAGTYFAPITSQCIPIDVNQGNPGGGDPGSGGQSCPNSCNPGQDQLPYPNCSCIG